MNRGAGPWCGAQLLQLGSRQRRGRGSRVVALGVVVRVRVGDRRGIWMQVVGGRMCRMCIQVVFTSRVTLRLIGSGACYSRVMMPSKSLHRMSALIYVMHATPRIIVYWMDLFQLFTGLFSIVGRGRHDDVRSRVVEPTLYTEGLVPYLFAPTSTPQCPSPHPTQDSIQVHYFRMYIFAILTRRSNR